MPLFRRKRDPYTEAADDDRAVIAALSGAGAKLDEPRHVLHYLYFSDESLARSAREGLTGSGFSGDVRPPVEGTTDWVLVCERHDYVLTPAAVVADREFFDSLATSRRGSYDGWEASV